MKLRIGDLVTFRDEGETRNQSGFITSLYAWYVSVGCVEVTIKRKDLRSIINKTDIIGVVPRMLVRDYWKHL